MFLLLKRFFPHAARACLGGNEKVRARENNIIYQIPYKCVSCSLKPNLNGEIGVQFLQPILRLMCFPKDYREGGGDEYN